MPNPLSDLIALIKVAKWAKEFSSLLYDFSNDAGTAWGEIQGFANQAMNFAHAVSAAHIALRKNCRDHSTSDVLTYLAQDHVAAGITAQCKIVRGRLVAAVSRLDVLLSGKSKILAFVKWSYQKGPILSILTDMEILKSTLNLLLTTIMVEILGSQRQNEKANEEDEDEKEKEISDDIHHLKKLVESHSKELNHLKLKLRREKELNVRQSVAPELEVVITRSLDSINRLGDSIIATGQVPSIITTSAQETVIAHASTSTVSINTSRPVLPMQGVYETTSEVRTLERNDAEHVRTKGMSTSSHMRMGMMSTGVSTGASFTIS